MVTLKILDGSHGATQLGGIFDDYIANIHYTNRNWTVFIKSLNDGITHVKHDEKDVTIIFKDELFKMFFMLKYL